MFFHQSAFGLATRSLEKVRDMSVIAFKAMRFAEVVQSSRDSSVAMVGRLASPVPALHPL